MLRKIALMGVCAATLALAKAPGRPVNVVTTDRVDFNGGTIRVNNTYGELNIEAWDQPQVEITATRTTFRHDSAKEREEGTAYLDRIKVSTQKAANGDVEISTQFPGRNRLLRVIHGLGDFTLDYRIKLPRNAKLEIRHGVGDIVIQNVAGDIDATVRSGDIVVQLPEPEKYAIDAQCTLGDVYTDFDGSHRSPWLVGQKFEAGSGNKVRLRALVGGISIQRSGVAAGL